MPRKAGRGGIPSPGSPTILLNLQEATGIGFTKRRVPGGLVGSGPGFRLDTLCPRRRRLRARGRAQHFCSHFQDPQGSLQVKVHLQRPLCPNWPARLCVLTWPQRERLEEVNPFFLFFFFYFPQQNSAATQKSYFKVHESALPSERVCHFGASYCETFCRMRSDSCLPSGRAFQLHQQFGFQKIVRPEGLMPSAGNKQ